MAEAPEAGAKPAARKTTPPWVRSPWLWTAVLLLPSHLALEAGGWFLMVVWALAALVLPRMVMWSVGWGRYWFGDAQRRLTALVLLGVLVLAGATTQVSYLGTRMAATDMLIGDEAETVYLPPPTLLKVASLGYPNFVSDLLFIRLHAYVNAHFDGDRIFTWMDAYYQAARATDPYNVRLYEFASHASKLGQRIEREDIEASIRYASDGLKVFPDHWRLYWDVGFNYFSELQRFANSPEEEAELRRKALPYLAIAAALPGSELDPNFVAGLYERDSDDEMALFHLYLRYWEANPFQREQIRGNLIRKGGAANAARLKRLEENWRADKPFISIGLYELIGEEARLGKVPATAKGWADVISGGSGL